MVSAEREYVLGHQPTELERLIAQSDFYAEISEHALRRAGVRPGMRVLDAGCGAGDVTLLTAGIVGPDGFVIGLDRAPEAVAAARDRAAVLGVQNVDFLEGDLMQFEVDAPVDAVVGRLVLFHCPDPVGAVRQLARHVLPGGVLHFQDFDVGGYEAAPLGPVVESTVDRVVTTFERQGIDPRIGLRLHEIFASAGLQATTAYEARIDPAPALRSLQMIMGITRTLLPLMDPSDRPDLDTLHAELEREIRTLGTIVVPPPMVSAWARLA